MKALLYYIAVPFIYLISLLPFWLLYRISDFLFVFIYYLIGYRKDIVMQNLRNSFPEKTDAERKVISRKFYRFFCDLIVETIKSLTISEATVKKRLLFTNLDIFEKYYNQKQSLIVAMGHLGNWELSGARFAVEPLHKLYVIYHPLQNKYFNRLVCHMRSRLGNGLYSMEETARGMIKNKDAVTATAFIADQTPSPKNAYWTSFLNQDTPVFTGTGKFSKKFNYPVVYISVQKVKRGYYEIIATDLVPNPEKYSDTEILDLFTKHLEADIKKIPETWLWSHRRWKHKRAKN